MYRHFRLFAIETRTPFKVYVLYAFYRSVTR